MMTSFTILVLFRTLGLLVALAASAFVGWRMAKHDITDDKVAWFCIAIGTVGWVVFLNMFVAIRGIIVVLAIIAVSVLAYAARWLFLSEYWSHFRDQMKPSQPKRTERQQPSGNPNVHKDIIRQHH
jgi:hypothetical protein